MAAHSELVHLTPRDSVLSRHELGGDALRDEVVELHQLGWKRCAWRHCVGTHRHTRHRFDSAGDGDVAHARLDEVRREMNPLLARAALAVDRGRWSGDRKTGGEPRVAADVEALLAGLGHATEHDG